MPERGFIQDLFLLAASVSTSLASENQRATVQIQVAYHQIPLQSAVVYYLIRTTINQLRGGDEKEQNEKRNAAAAVLRRLDARNDDDADKDGGRKRSRPGIKYLELNRYEQVIAMDVVSPEDIPVTFDDIGGLGETIDELKEAIIYPLTMPELFAHPSSLLSAPSGVLLFGPPGCGKTMLAKAMAHESDATFINLHISTLTEKWYGDSNKLVHAVFTLARKLQPSIIFIDEIDALLGTRRSGEHEAGGQVKAEFMTLWDGLNSADITGKPQSIMILGATNRPQDIDEAILRRMPKKFLVPLPSEQQRRRIFGLILKGTRIDEDSFDLDFLVRVSAGMSGSDIKEACRDAALTPMREYFRQRKAAGSQLENMNVNEIRGLRTTDFFESAGGIKASRQQARLIQTPATTETEESSTDDEQDDVISR